MLYRCCNRYHIDGLYIFYISRFYDWFYDSRHISYVFCWCLLLMLHYIWLFVIPTPASRGRTPPAGRGPKTRGRSAFCFRRGPLGPAVVVTLPQAVGNVRKVLKKLRRETRKLHRNLESLWHFLNIWNIYPNYSSSFWRWFFHFQIFQCFFLSLLALITVWASWCWFFLALHPRLLTCRLPSIYIKIVSTYVDR